MSSLKKRQNTNGGNLSSKLPNIGGILQELQPLLHCSEKCKKAIRDLSMMAFGTPKSLGDYLVHAKLKTEHTGKRPKGTVKCGQESCQVCNYLCPGDTFTSKTTGHNFSINYDLNCNSNNVVYLMCCKVCGIQNVWFKNMQWVWYDEHRCTIDKLKQALTNSPVLQNFNSDKPITIQTDASQSGISSCLQEGHPAFMHQDR